MECIRKKSPDVFDCMKKLGQLFVVATPIGNWGDITQRAKDVLNAVDLVVCEQHRVGSTLLKKAAIQKKELLELNEHNEKEQTPYILSLLLEGEDIALTSDCGTPAFADPGSACISQAMQYGIRVIPVPGPSSLMAAISVSPIALKEFVFVGFLPRKNDQRLAKLKQCREMKKPLILMDTPYRLERVVSEVVSIFGKKQLVTLAFNLTQTDEQILHGTVHEISNQLKTRKGEFVLIVHR